MVKKKILHSGLITKYFVIKPGGKDAYAKASRKAMEAYAASIREENWALSEDLIAWVNRAKGFAVGNYKQALK